MPSAYRFLLIYVLYRISPLFISFTSSTSSAVCAAPMAGAVPLMGGGPMSTIFVSAIASCVRMVSTNMRMLASKVGQGTYSLAPMKQASFAPRKMVKRRVGGAFGEVARVMMRSKSDFRREDV
ncbi:predicted protein [Plenodomus lingam JN3]|uniref:Predicted protein n=1 Tax=Leptosphaeria maculans (strain JN3 / isolate v23.1.3 / race Av1-4-5-6-7-8) TaxID=985895 RepID=E4ZRV8_LEPMJ|nr:predicted protein [Plenodomus lingam JN3]CBX93955.1 predicted protein [Plenodomus lingam JN3]